MEGPNGIEGRRGYVSPGVRVGARVAVHLTKPKAAGTDYGPGLIGSGPCSICKIYSCLN